HPSRRSRGFGPHSAGDQAAHERALSGRAARGSRRPVSPAAVTVSPPRRYYLDTSAYLCMLLGEAGGDRLTAETAGAELASSVLLILEAKRTLVRLARQGHLSPDEFKTCLQRVDQDQDLLVLRDLTLDLCGSNLLPAIATPRSLDLAHLRTALWFH